MPDSATETSIKAFKLSLDEAKDLSPTRHTNPSPPVSTPLTPRFPTPRRVVTIAQTVLVGTVLLSLLRWHPQIADVGQWAQSMTESLRFQGEAALSHRPTIPATLDGSSSPSCSSIPDPPRPLVPALGETADEVFDNVGSSCLADYSSELAGFIEHSLPQRERSLAQSTSLGSRFRTYLNDTLDSSSRKNEAGIPRQIFQTSKTYSMSHNEDAPKTWVEANPGWAYQQSDDRTADEWVRETFGEAGASKKQRLDEKGSTGIAEIWRRLAGTPVMRSDFWRYLVMLKEGGVYSDVDTRCLKSIDQWSQWEGHSAGGNGEWAGDIESRGPPNVIVGIEADVGDRTDWHDWWPRPLEIVQWTIAASPGHPILLDTVRRVVTALETKYPSSDLIELGYSRSQSGNAIIDLTGPGPFTDAVLAYLGVMTNGKIRWADLRSLPVEGLRVGDVLVLPITGFSPGVGHMGAGEIDAPGAFVKHEFLGSWKNER